VVVIARGVDQDEVASAIAQRFLGVVQDRRVLAGTDIVP